MTSKVTISRSRHSSNSGSPLLTSVPVTCDHNSPDGSSDEAGINPQEECVMFNGNPVSIKDVNIIEEKGKFLGAVGDETYCRQEIAIEAQIYKRLGAHPRLVQLNHWDPVDHTLTLEYMPHGNLKEYGEKHGQKISPAQRQQWVTEAAGGVALLHSHGVIQSDVGPHNFLLDMDLSLFGGYSLDDSRATVVPGVRYRLPNLDDNQLATIKGDLFALGSTIYFIATGHGPYNELADEEQIENLDNDGVFPELGGVLFAGIIAICWRREAESSKAIVELVHQPN